jgi:hypothetical protein
MYTKTEAQKQEARRRQTFLSKPSADSMFYPTFADRGPECACSV